MIYVLDLECNDLFDFDINLPISRNEICDIQVLNITDLKIYVNKCMMRETAQCLIHSLIIGYKDVPYRN